jgi:hypothetical protein
MCAGWCFTTAAAIWYQQAPGEEAGGQGHVTRGDGRRFLPPQLLRQGFDRNQDIHTSTGAGMRFFLRSVAVPLVASTSVTGYPTARPGWC